MAKSWSQADVVALIAQLLSAGGKVDNQLMADVTGKSTPSGYQHKMRVVIRHAKLVVEDRAKGGKGLLSALPGAEESAEAGVDSTPKGKRKGVGDGVGDAATPSKRGKKAGKKADSPVEDDKKIAKVKSEDDESDVTKDVGKLADSLGTDGDGYEF